MKNTSLTIVAPIFNEIENIPNFFAEIIPILNSIEDRYEIEVQLKFFDNASTDGTYDALVLFARDIENFPIEVISWIRNYGVMASIFGGLHYTDTDLVLILDFDLQDPPELILELVEKSRQGFSFVYGRRAARTEGVRMRLLRKAFMGFAKLLGINSDEPVESGAWLLNKYVVEDLKTNPPTTNYLAGALGRRGFHSSSVAYIRRDRAFGSSKFSLLRYLGYGSEALLSNPHKFMRAAMALGVASVSFGIAIEIFFFANRYIFHVNIPNGIPLTVLLQIVSSASIFILLGIIGEYVARVFQSISRPEIPIIARQIKLNEER